jgi:hypothetical protein
VRIVLAAIALVYSTAGYTQSAITADPSDAVMTILPARDVSYNESFAKRRKAVSMRADPSLSAEERARAAVSDFTGCLYDFNARAGRRVLSSGVGKPLQKTVQDYADGQCWLRGYVSFRPSVFQAALFTTAYKIEFGKLKPQLAPEPVDFTKLSESATQEQRLQYLALRRFGECVIRSNLQGTHGLVLTDVASAKEKAAFAAIAPTFSGCIDTGRSVALTKDLIKGVMAEILYRHASQVSAGAKQ